MLSELFRNIADWYMGNMNYGTILLLMAIESSVLPLPSEVVIPPAAWKAAQGDMNFFLVIIFATLGAICGALFNYFISLIVGRKIVYAFADSKVGHLFLLDKAKVQKAENYFIKHGRSSTFIGRLVPGIRHLISIPAGLAKMKLGQFVLFTAAGSLIWHTILATLGYTLYSQKELLDKYFSEISYVLLALGIIFIAYLVFKAYKKKKASTN